MSFEALMIYEEAYIALLTPRLPRSVPPLPPLDTSLGAQGVWVHRGDLGYDLRINVTPLFFFMVRALRGAPPLAFLTRRRPLPTMFRLPTKSVCENLNMIFCQ